jgi:hypothetical protein
MAAFYFVKNRVKNIEWLGHWLRKQWEPNLCRKNVDKSQYNYVCLPEGNHENEGTGSKVNKHEGLYMSIGDMSMQTCAYKYLIQ